MLQTGKIYLVIALWGILQSKCIVTATTNKTSFSIQGETIYALLKLPNQLHAEAKVAARTSVYKLQETDLNGINSIFIDEYSLLSQQTVGWIDRRCKQETGNNNNVLGGKSVVLM